MRRRSGRRMGRLPSLRPALAVANAAAGCGRRRSCRRLALPRRAASTARASPRALNGADRWGAMPSHLAAASRRRRPPLHCGELLQCAAARDALHATACDKTRSCPRGSPSCGVLTRLQQKVFEDMRPVNLMVLLLGLSAAVAYATTPPPLTSARFFGVTKTTEYLNVTSPGVVNFTVAGGGVSSTWTRFGGGLGAVVAGSVALQAGQMGRALVASFSPLLTLRARRLLLWLSALLPFRPISPSFPTSVFRRPVANRRAAAAAAAASSFWSTVDRRPR